MLISEIVMKKKKLLKISSKIPRHYAENFIKKIFWHI